MAQITARDTELAPPHNFMACGLGNPPRPGLVVKVKPKEWRQPASG
jgi:hypothetical protein